MDAQLGPGQDLKHLIERAQTARQDDERVGHGGHHHLALVHGLHDVQFGDGVVAQFARFKELGDDAHDPAVAFERGVGDSTHEARAAATIDEGDASACEFTANGLRTFRIIGSSPVARAAKNRQTFDGTVVSLSCHGRGYAGLQRNVTVRELRMREDPLHHAER